MSVDKPDGANDDAVCRTGAPKITGETETVRRSLVCWKRQHSAWKFSSADRVVFLRLVTSQSIGKEAREFPSLVTGVLCILASPVSSFQRFSSYPRTCVPSGALLLFFPRAAWRPTVTADKPRSRCVCAARCEIKRGSTNCGTQGCVIAS